MKNFLLNILKILICLLLNGLLFLIAYIPLFAREYDWQLSFYLVFFVILILGTWAVFFLKKDIYIKIIYTILFLIFLNAYKIFPSVKQEYDSDICIDSGVCQEGVKVQTEKAVFVITKESCKKYGYKWNEKRKDCSLR